VLDLTEDEFDFLTSNKVWIATDRSRARRCVEACVYGTLDFVGYPRFPAPVEYIAAVIAYYVHHVNIQTACLIMEGAKITENIINGVERSDKTAEQFAFTLRVRTDNTDVIVYYVHPVNIQTACLIMEGAEFTENIINGVERPVKAAELFAFTLRVRAGNTDVLTDAEENVRQKLRAEGVM